jgi:hypothetical protein
MAFALNVNGNCKINFAPVLDGSQHKAPCIQ